MSKSSGSGFFPVARPIPGSDNASSAGSPESLQALQNMMPNPDLPQGNLPIPFPPLHFCALSLPQGCYQLNITSTASSPTILFRSFKLGTLRVQPSGTGFVISGDTYRYSFLDLLHGGIPSFGPTEIPIYPRSRYGSYLKATSVFLPKFSYGPCRITLALDEYDYTQPPAGSFDGSFPTTPSRSMTIYLTPAPPASGFTGAYFTGTVAIGSVTQPGMNVTLAWVSHFYRKATVEVHTMAGAVAPGPVGSEYLPSTYAKAGWDMTVKTDPNPIPAPTVAGGFPPGWTATSNWGSPSPGVGLLHMVMTNLIDFSSVNLDKVWYQHLLVVPAAIGDGRGIMFDTINVPREGVASFSDDGYPTSDSSNFGPAANKKQRDVPRAFLRSATHEVTHGFNQIHQENEGGADNSIMTTSPGVANYLASHGGTFPDGIVLDFNDHVRHHLIHLPDIVIRPGGMTWTAGHNGIPVPQSDTEGDEIYVDHPALELKLAAGKGRVKLGEPLELTWELQNVSDAATWMPGDLSVSHEFAEVSVTKPGGEERQMPPYAIKCDAAFFVNGKPGHRLSAQHTLFWSTQGFAFETPGRHTVNLEISWGSNGATIGKRASIDVFVDYPVSNKDNDVIAHMLNDEVGKFIALGGHAYHLETAIDHIDAVVAGHTDHPAGKAMAVFYDPKVAAKHKNKEGEGRSTFGTGGDRSGKRRRSLGREPEYQTE